MHKELFLHIGTPKTGTSALQFFCDQNINEFRKLGYEYASWSNKKDNINSIISSHDSWSKKAKRIEGLFENYKKLIISSEAIWLYWRNEKAIFDEISKLGIDIKIIVYIRNQEEYIESMICQEIKSGKYVTDPSVWCVDEIVNRKDANYVKDITESAHYLHGINKLAESVGQDNVLVRVYEKERMKNKNIYDDFLDVLAIKNSKRFIKPKPEVIINPSLDDSTLQIKRLINSVCGDEIAVETLRNITLHPLIDIMTQKMSVGKKTSSKNIFSVEDKCKIREMFEEENLILSSKYMNSNEAFLFKYKSKPEVEENYNTSSHEVLEDTIKLFAKLLLTLAIEREDDKKEVEWVKRQLLVKEKEIEDLKTIVYSQGAVEKKQGDCICEKELSLSKKIISKVHQKISGGSNR